MRQRRLHQRRGGSASDFASIRMPQNTHVLEGRGSPSLYHPVPAGDLQFACLRAGTSVGALKVRRQEAFASCAIAEGQPVRCVPLEGTTFDVGHSAAGRGTEPVTLPELDLHRLPTDSAGFHDVMFLGNAATSRAVDGHDAERAGNREFRAVPLAPTVSSVFRSWSGSRPVTAAIRAQDGRVSSARRGGVRTPGHPRMTQAPP